MPWARDGHPHFRPKICGRCGNQFEISCGAAKYCPSCRSIHRTELIRDWKRGARQRVEYRKDQAEAGKLWNRVLRHQFLMAYGGKCACCGETEERFLTFDHIHGNGGAFRKKYSYGRGQSNTTREMQRLRREGFPPQNDYQVLCYNCNCAKGFYGICPHKLEVKSEVA